MRQCSDEVALPTSSWHGGVPHKLPYPHNVAVCSKNSTAYYSLSTPHYLLHGGRGVAA